ncbi:MAG: hypothetical protein ACPGO5_02420 [Patescibacteria group bacterium]
MSTECVIVVRGRNKDKFNGTSYDLFTSVNTNDPHDLERQKKQAAEKYHYWYHDWPYGVWVMTPTKYRQIKFGEQPREKTVKHKKKKNRRRKKAKLIT